MSKEIPGATHYDVLGVAMGASIDHVKDSYRLLTKKSPATDAAYRVLTDPTLRRDYDSKLRAGETTHNPVAHREDYFVVCDGAVWQVIGDRDVGWELQALFPDRKVRVKAPKPVFGPFSKMEAEEFAERKRHEAASNGGNHESRGYWAEWGAPTEMPQRPPLPTHTELQYIAGIERMLGSGTPLGVLETILEYTPEQLLEASGISLETESDLEFFIRYVQWLTDVVAWHKSLSRDLAAMVAERLEVVVQGRYRFLVAGVDKVRDTGAV
jgi:hypothetical protein